MKITQHSDSELELSTSGTTNLIVGIAIVIIGVGVTASPLFTSAEWWVSLIGLVVLALGGGIVATASNASTVLRRQGTSTISEKKIIGGSTKEASFESSQITKIRLDSHTEYTTSSSDESNGKQQRQRVSVLYAVLQDGTEITLGSDRVNGNGGFSLNGVGLSSVSKAPLSKEAQQIADFLGVPLSTGMQDIGLQDVVGAVRTAFTQPVAPTATVPSAQAASTNQPTQPLQQQPPASIQPVAQSPLPVIGAPTTVEPVQDPSTPEPQDDQRQQPLQ